MIKGRTCAYGIKKREYFKKGESFASTTVFLEQLVTTFVIDSKEGRYVATFYFPILYLQYEIPNNNTVFLNLNGEFFGYNLRCE